jgi:hypothetical protein
MVWAIPDFAIPDFGGSSALTACLGAKVTFVPLKMDNPLGLLQATMYRRLIRWLCKNA